jgi:hypothetical protein
LSWRNTEKIVPTETFTSVFDEPSSGIEHEQIATAGVLAGIG